MQINSEKFRMGNISHLSQVIVFNRHENQNEYKKLSIIQVNILLNFFPFLEFSNRKRIWSGRTYWAYSRPSSQNVSSTGLKAGRENVSTDLSSHSSVIMLIYTYRHSCKYSPNRTYIYSRRGCTLFHQLHIWD